MKWFEISKKVPQDGQVVWFSRPTRKDRVPVLVRAVITADVGYGASSWFTPGNSKGLTMRWTDQWTEPVVPAPPRLLKGK